MQAVGETHVILAKENSHHLVPEDWRLVNAMMTTDTFCSNYKEDGKSKSYDPVQVSWENVPKPLSSLWLSCWGRLGLNECLPACSASWILRRSAVPHDEAS